MSKRQYEEKQRFDMHLRRLGERVYPTTEDGFDRELAKLNRIDEKVRSNLDEYFSASLGSNIMKNRFPDVKPNEGTIVRLNETSLRGDGTYINANYVDARKKFNVPFVYIATQAPMKNTVLDFWRMVYENDAAFIVMLCAVEENGKVKSQMYWPPRSKTYDLGILSVTLVAESMRQDLIHRRLLLRSITGDQKEVFHMQYLAWPDQGVPQGSVTLMEVIYTIAKSPRSTQSPVVVHCSGGVGRTGVFIGLHIALAQFQLSQENISIPRIVCFLKACRSGMVRRKDQYLFLYYAVQREMKRMLLSKKNGVNLLDSRPRLTVPTVARFDPASTQMDSPLVTPIPARHRKRGTTSIFAPLRSSTYSNKRTADDDAATMENYLQRAVPSLNLGCIPGMSHPAHLRSPGVASRDVFHPTSPSPRPPLTSTPREQKMPWGQADVPRATMSHVLPRTSLLQTELARQRGANRMKRFSPSRVHSAGDGSTAAFAETPP
ncbi:hypothetical protein JKF63_00815 [Porcisia hertigi]|uniref:Uncharacterized protein n=1 Tax=Porcisia hertigi TaxID=2761500 RepID=A0A836IA92_9TRYP|nr:hypothetical protein JKF63_00815 [Porcisia hertigi]